MTDRRSEALERLNQGIEESRQEVQRRTMSLAQDYFGDSTETLKEHIQESRDTLKSLPDQIPGGQEEAFQALFQELMDNYSTMEECINQAQTNVANLDTDQIRRQGEVEATDAAKRQAKELGVDLTQIEGTGSDGRIIVSDVVEAAEAMQEAQGEDGAGAAGQAQDAAGQAASQAQNATGQATGQAQQVAGQVTDQAQQAAGQVTDQAGQAVQGVQDAVGGLAGGQQQDGGPLGGVTEQVGQVAQQAQNAAGQGGGEVQGTGTDGAEEPKVTNAARRKAEELGVDLSQVQGTGSGGLITLKDVTGS